MRWVLLGMLLFATPLAVGASAAPFTQIDAAMETARQNQMPLLAPLAWDRASQAYDRARDNFARDRAPEQTTKYINEAAAALASATDTMRLARVNFGAVLTSRANALSAGADKLAPRTFANAEDQFRKATVNFEQGRASKSQTQTVEAVQTYRTAELDAIRGVILRDAYQLLEQAEDENVEKYAPQTLTQAREAYAEADRAIVEDRYDTDRARLLAKRAKEQASHALHLAAQIKGVNDDRAFEELLLRSEAPVVDIAVALGTTPDLSNGVTSTAAATLAAVKRSQQDLAKLKLELDERDERIATLETTLGSVSQETVALTTLLAEQQERRDQLIKVEQLFTPTDAEVLRTSNSVVLRLVGLHFDSGAATIETDALPLLGKVEQAINIFGDGVMTVEGHTDSFGGDELNLELSQRRADAVRSYLLESMGLAPYRVSALGYGETKPIASNETADGRVRNRRIDLVISRSVD